jgi:hypothetical protein
MASAIPPDRRTPGPLLRRGPDALDGDALIAWVATRAAVLLLALGAAAGLATTARSPGLDEQWGRWDAALLAEIARFGYRGDPATAQDRGLPAFFPGQPLLLRLAHVAVHDWTLAGLLVSWCAGVVAVIALARLAAFEAGCDRAGRYAVWALLLSPPAVFLFAGYTEAPFLAFALPAWLFARQRRWRDASLAAAGASSMRITGLFLTVALIVEFVVARHRDPEGGPRWRQAAWLCVPVVPVVLYFAYQHGRTGDWLAWLHAEQAGWDRRLVSPLTALRTSWDAAFHTSDQFTWSSRAELVGALAGVVLTLWLAWRRRSAELTYIGLQVAALVCSTYYLSVPRAALLWWPLWTGIGRTAARRPWVLCAYAAVSAPLMAADVVVFTFGGWAG